MSSYSFVLSGMCFEIARTTSCLTGLPVRSPSSSSHRSVPPPLDQPYGTHVSRARSNRNDLPAAKKRRIRSRDANCCCWCGATSLLVVHHIIHMGEGGTNWDGNLITLCPKHHSAVHADPATWQPRLLLYVAWRLATGQLWRLPIRCCTFDASTPRRTIGPAAPVARFLAFPAAPHGTGRVGTPAPPGLSSTLPPGASVAVKGRRGRNFLAAAPAPPVTPLASHRRRPETFSRPALDSGGGSPARWAFFQKADGGQPFSPHHPHRKAFTMVQLASVEQAFVGPGVDQRTRSRDPIGTTGRVSTVPPQCGATAQRLEREGDQGHPGHPGGQAGGVHRPHVTTRPVGAFCP